MGIKEHFTLFTRVLYPVETKKILCTNAIFLETISNDFFQSQSLENTEEAPNSSVGTVNVI